MKFTAKQLNKLSQKQEKESLQEKKKVKAAIDKGNLEIARIHGENTIRKKNESLQMLQLSSRIDGTASKLQSIAAQRGVARQLGSISQQLGQAMQSMDTMAIAQSMDQFERQLGDLEVQGNMIGAVMDSSTAGATPVDSVDALISEVADEAGMDLGEKLPTMNFGAPAAAAQPEAQSQEDELQARLEALK